MTPKERMLIAIRNGLPDMAPVAPDISNMIPCKLTGRPFWDIYLYNNPPLWRAYIDAVRIFGFDGWLADDPSFHKTADAEGADHDFQETVIVHRDEERIVTREYVKRGSVKEWSPLVTVYYRADPPSRLPAEKVGLSIPPEHYEPIEKSPPKDGLTSLREALEYMGDDGVVGMAVMPPSLGRPGIDPYSIYDYVDRYDEAKAWAERSHEAALRRLGKILSADIRPDFILTGGSGLLIFNTPAILKDLTLPTLRDISKLCKKADMPTQVHCCGPEKELIGMCAEDTDIDSINPLEQPPMGDCRLADIKRQYGGRISLMGNIHTTDVMLLGDAHKVTEECRKALDAAAAGGGFILSTGDQCGRDTPFENLHAFIDTARDYGRY